MDSDSFIIRWSQSGAAERANYQLFLSELCDLLGVERPQPTVPDERANAYVFEKAVPLPHGTTGRIDLYKRGCFVLEAKQGSGAIADSGLQNAESNPQSIIHNPQSKRRGTAVRGTAAWDTAMEKARAQAQSYARNLPLEEIEGGRPPFLIVVDVGNTIELYSEFSRTGGNYIPFPDPTRYRLRLDALRQEESRALLRQVWTEPMALDPAQRSARVTREIAARLAALARSLEGAYAAEEVAHFLMRCLFTMFAEDVGLLPDRGFTQLLVEMAADPQHLPAALESLWATMNVGGFSPILRKPVPRFNGGLFAEQRALPLDRPQIGLLIEAARADWRDVEPAIFGTLLERALDPRERHKLGAHYTPRAYVERLVKPTVIEPLQAEWESVKVAAAQLADQGQMARAIREMEAFQRRLAAVRVLDPACGSGNFLYVTLEHLKRLEGEVLNTLRELGQGQMLLDIESIMVTPQQFLGIEVNPRAAAIAELVLWIGYLQWHLRTRGDVTPPEPIIRDFHNIECRDAVLAWDAVEPLLDGDGRPVTRWDGRTTKAHPVTGEQVPDESARVLVYRYIGARPAEWPAADFIVGNPPFIGNYRMREALGDGYSEALRSIYTQVPQTADYVMYWWHKAALQVRESRTERFGLITTNSLKQNFNRRVLQNHLNGKEPLSLVFAVSDHPWVDSAQGAAVRISMTVGEAGEKTGILQEIVAEYKTETEEAEVVLSSRIGKIQSDLTIGANVVATVPLKANQGISCPGVKVNGSAFIVTADQASDFGLGLISGIENYIRPYLSGRDLNQVSRQAMVIDLYGLSADDVRARFPEIYQWLYARVKPERDQNRDARVRDYWWIHGRPRPELRLMLKGLRRYISTVETSKHRFFVYQDVSVLPDNTIVAIGLEDAYFLGVLSSYVHGAWALASGGRLEDRPRYQKALCFDPFPFPDASEAQKARIRDLAEQLDAHRKRQQALHPGLTMTGMYNVLEKLRAAEQGSRGVEETLHSPLSEAERRIHEEGLVSVLQQLHDELDDAVFDAYGWQDLRGLPRPLRSDVDETILQRLVALNAERAAEEARGHIRWLRPAYQAPETAEGQQLIVDLGLGNADLGTIPQSAITNPQLAWPDGMAAQAQAVRSALAALTAQATVDGGATAETVAGLFSGRRTAARVRQVAALLETLAALGQAEEVGEGVYAAV